MAARNPVDRGLDQACLPSSRDNQGNHFPQPLPRDSRNRTIEPARADLSAARLLTRGTGAGGTPAKKALVKIEDVAVMQHENAGVVVKTSRHG